MKQILIIGLVFFPFLGWSQLYEGEGLDTIDSCYFETSCDIVYLSADEGNLWQIGKPQKVLFDSAYSPEWVIVTDTVAHYPVGNHSWFQIGVLNPHLYTIRLSFSHRIDSDSNLDGGYVEISTDSGATWTNVVLDSINGGAYYPDISSDSFYSISDTLYNGQPGFSGTSPGWIHSQFQWIWGYPVRPGGIDGTLSEPSDSVLFRFHFISDSTDNGKEGWMIDNIKVSWVYLGSGVYDIPNHNIELSVLPNPARDNMTVGFDNPRQLRHTILMTTMSGTLARKFENLRSESLLIERDGLPPGVYLVTVRSEEGATGRAKLVLE